MSELPAWIVVIGVIAAIVLAALLYFGLISLLLALVRLVEAHAKLIEERAKNALFIEHRDP